MALQTRPQTTEIEYVRAPWHLRLRWWLAARMWRFGRALSAISADAPELANPLWRR
jgi:hypothetical protein